MSKIVTPLLALGLMSGLGCAHRAPPEDPPATFRAGVVNRQNTVEPKADTVEVPASQPAREVSLHDPVRRPRGPEPTASRHRGVGGKIASIAAGYLKRKPRLVRNDCSGLVMTVLKEANVDFVGSTEQMWNAALKSGQLRQRPQVGDLAFFDNTWDRNRNGVVGDDWFSHVAVVTAVDGDQVELVHKIPSGIKRLRLNLKKPHKYKESGTVLNDFLRSPRYGPRRKGQRMAGQLVRGFGAVW